LFVWDACDHVRNFLSIPINTIFAMTAVTPSATRALVGHRPFVLYFCARTCSEFSAQIGAVAVGWQVYALTGSAFDLGMVGLVQFIPTAVLVFLAGHAADRYDRRRVVQACQIVDAATAAFLTCGSFGGWLNVEQIFAAVAVFGVTTAFESPAVAALLPAVAPQGMLQKATAFSTGAFQAAMISGPALGGFAYAVAPGVPYAVMTVIFLLGFVLNGLIAAQAPPGGSAQPTIKALFAGVGFARRNPAILGGATALLPIYAHDILHTGPWGLGVLRGAPAVGALLMTAVLTHYAITRRVGLRMFQAVIVFGAATIVFAVSHSIWLSIIALAVMGAADTISMVIRIALVQLATPDEMRGRVGAVNFLFVNASYQLGEFESGVTAALFGAMPAVVLGGLGTIVVALIWMKLFPSLRQVERLE
jgi:MFS family permease